MPSNIKLLMERLDAFQLWTSRCEENKALSSGAIVNETWQIDFFPRANYLFTVSMYLDLSQQF